MSRRWYASRTARCALAAGALAAVCVRATGAADLSQLDLATLMSMDVVLVNAQKRIEDVNKVPISITVIRADAAQRACVESTSDLQVIAPGLTTTIGGGSLIPYIRGVGTDNNVSTEPSVSVYVDEIYQPSSAQTRVAFADLEQIEVLRSPQGTLFGRNTTGGAINITTRAPSAEPQADVRVATGSRDLRDASAFIVGPLGSHVRASFAAHARKQDSYYEHILGADSPAFEDSHNLHGRVQFDLTPTLAGEVLVRYLDLEAPGSEASELSSHPLGVLFGAPIAREPFESAGNPDYNREHSHGTVNALKLAWQGTSVTARSITSYSDVKGHVQFDLDGTIAALMDVSTERSDRTFTQELQLFSNADGRFDWLAGAFYMDATGVTSAAISTMTLEGPATFTYAGSFVTKTYALFGEGTYAFGPAWSVTAGVRYSDERKAFKVADAGRLDDFIGAGDRRRVPVDDVSYRFVVKHTRERTLLYAKTETSFKSAVPTLTGAATPPERITAYELGLKHDFASLPVHLDAAAFFNDYRHLQLGVASETVSAADLGEPPDARTHGVDLGIDAKLSKHWKLNAGMSWLETRYRNFIADGVYVPNPVLSGNMPSVDLDLSGNRLSRSPRLSGNIGATFEYPWRDGTVFAAANYYRSGQVYFEPSNLYSQAPFGLLNATLGYRSRAGWHVSAWAKNLTEETYIESVYPTFAGTIAEYAEPRSAGVSLGYRFGR